MRYAARFIPPPEYSLSRPRGENGDSLAPCVARWLYAYYTHGHTHFARATLPLALAWPSQLDAGAPFDERAKPPIMHSGPLLWSEGRAPICKYPCSSIDDCARSAHTFLSHLGWA